MFSNKGIDGSTLTSVTFLVEFFFLISNLIGINDNDKGSSDFLRKFFFFFKFYLDKYMFLKKLLK